MKMKHYLTALIGPAVFAAAALVATLAKAEPKRVIDLGEMEIEGELRRPNLTLIDKSRGSEELPEIHRRLFMRLESELLARPRTLAQANSVLSTTPSEDKTHVNR